MKEELERNGGRETLDASDGQCTHVVVDDATVTAIPADVSNPFTKIVLIFVLVV